MFLHGGLCLGILPIIHNTYTCSTLPLLLLTFNLQISVFDRPGPFPFSGELHRGAQGENAILARLL